MKTRSLLLIIIATLFCLPHRSLAQLAVCTSDVPFFSVNLAGHPSGSWTSPSHSRDGQCYDATAPTLCTSFRVLVDTGAAMIKLEIVSGALPAGAMYYQVNGGPEIPVATPISISGTGPFDITFCKPGNNKNTYKISTISHATASITGATALSVCSHTTLSCGVAGGTWSSSNTSVATVNSSGVVTGVATGTANIIYIINSSTVDIATVTVNPLPAITGNNFVCGSGTTALANATPGGAWSSNNTSVATVSGSGVVSGVASGTATISYNVGATCSATKVISVNPSVTTINGALSVCTGAVTTLTNATPGGTWSSSSNGIATINSSGIATGVAVGTVKITYQISGGCRDTKVLTVNVTPGSITGAATVCVGSAITLANTTAGGTWSSADGSIATVDASGVVSSVTAGATSISYSTSAGCTITKRVTVNAIPSLSGIDVVCDNKTITLSGTPTGGTWHSSNGAIAAVNPSGIVTGASAGTVNISYQLSAGCYALGVVTVNDAPSSISGANTVCEGASITLANTLSGGVWVSSDTTVAIVDSNGVVTGVDAGPASISYTTVAGCGVTKSVTVNAIPSMSGVAAVCDNKTITLSGAPAGGTWHSSNGAIAAVNPSGIVTGASAGTVNISYQLSAGCYALGVVTVNEAPSSISGANAVCEGASITLANTLSGGIWVSGDPTVAIVDSNGVVIGVDAGSVAISYTTAAGCAVTKSIAVNNQPSFSGAGVVCEDQTVTLVGTPTGGTWHSTDNGIASVNAAGVLTGNGAGTTNITYQVGSCKAIAQETVNARPVAISGSSSVCSGSCATFSAGCTGGNWVCTDTTIGTMECTGVFHPGSCGATTIAYVSAEGCSVTKALTVNAVSSIVGRDQVCKNLTTTLSCAVTGGHWDTNPHAVADINDATGILQGKDTGTVTISYTTAAGCVVTRHATVNQYVYPLETSPLTSPMQKNICVGTNLQLNSPYGGSGIWTTSDTTIATVTNTVPGSSVLWGLVTGHSAGAVTISYTAYNGCISTAMLTINPMPSISGVSTVCRYATTTLAGTPAGGQWFSHNAAVASVGINNGVVMGASAGTASIFYRLYNFDACSASTVETVNVCTGSKEENDVQQMAGAVPDGYDVYPNPGNGRFTIRHDGVADGSTRVIVVNYMGQSVYEGSVLFSGGRGVLDITNVQPGIYLVQLEGKPGERNVLRVSVQ